METERLLFNGLIKSKIETDYKDKVVILYDADGSAYDEFEDNELMNPSLLMYVFDTLEEAKNVLENGNLKINIVNNFTAMFVNGVYNKSLIVELRG